MRPLRSLQKTLSRQTEKGQLIDPARHVLPGGHNCAEVCLGLMGRIPDRVVRLDKGPNSRPLLISDGDGSGKLKLYWVGSEKIAGEIKQATEVLLRKGVTIPRVHGTLGSYVLSDWVTGVTLEKEPLPGMVGRMADYQARLHSAYSGCTSPKEYLEMLFRKTEDQRPRLLRRLSGQELDRIVQILQELAPDPMLVGVSNSDIRLNNLIWDEKGSVCLIDNERLHLGPGIEGDVLRAAYMSFRKIPWKIPAYLAHCISHIPGNTLLKSWNFWNMIITLWRLKESIRKGRRELLSNLVYETD